VWSLLPYVVEVMEGPYKGEGETPPPKPQVFYVPLLLAVVATDVIGATSEADRIVNDLRQNPDLYLHLDRTQPFIKAG
jgi:hypothetical protein